MQTIQDNLPVDDCIKTAEKRNVITKAFQISQGENEAP